MRPMGCPSDPMVPAFYELLIRIPVRNTSTSWRCNGSIDRTLLQKSSPGAARSTEYFQTERTYTPSDAAARSEGTRVRERNSHTERKSEMSKSTLQD